MNKLNPLTLLCCFSMLSSISVFGQCKGFAKKKCLPLLKPYVSNGQMNAVQVYPGEDTELEITLNKGLSYRVVVGTEASLGSTAYELNNESGQVLKSDTLKEGLMLQDLKVDRSQTLTLSLSIAEQKNTTEIYQNGCVVVLIGFKED